MTRASEAAISGDDDYDLSEYNIPPGLQDLLDLAVGETKEPAVSIWNNMQEYARIKGRLAGVYHNDRKQFYYNQQM